MFNKDGSELRLSKRGDRQNVFRIERFKNDHGFQVYALENAAEGKKIFIPRFVFGRFRACVRTIVQREIRKDAAEPFEYSVSFLNRDYFYFKSSPTDIDNLIIQDIEERDGSTGYITVSRRRLHVLEALLYSDKLQHPNDVLEEIIAYHKLFQFSFVKGSKSITSDLILRKDVLQSIERYTPSLAQKVTVERTEKEEGADAERKQPPAKPAAKRGKEAKLYKPKLGERFNEKDIRVDYDEIFGGAAPSGAASSDTEEGAKGKARRTSLKTQFSIPLPADEVKDFGSGRFYFELSAEEASEFRERFISDRSADFFLGFEIVDALFSYNRSIRTFRFPLYYMKVRIRESGRGVYLEPSKEGLFHLNHLALAHMVEKFSEVRSGVDPVDRFFTTLLAQDVSVDRLNDRIHVSRHLPVKEAVFDRTREILFGYRDENGKGGILGDLNVKGIEVDLQSICLYRAPRLLNPLAQALDIDLDQINAIAHQSSRRFYSSLLGRFLTPEQDGEEGRTGRFAPVLWMPGALPRSTRTLVDRLEHHDIVLLEGPPGTGKTFTIMNLLLHCINSNQRVLIVSDQQAAIEALIEKLQEYLIGDDRGTPSERKWKDLLFSAIKVIDEVEIGEQGLTDLLSGLAKTFKVQEWDNGSAHKGERLEKRLVELGARIEALKAEIGRKMDAHLAEEVRFDYRVHSKEEGGTDYESLREFLQLVFSRKSREREAVAAFIDNRLELREDAMEECYDFFKVPTKSFAAEVQRLKGDAKVLADIVDAKPRTLEDFYAVVQEHPRHELIRYLEALMQAHVTRPRNVFSRLLKSVLAAFRLPLQTRAGKLQRMVTDQIALLKMADSLSEGTWALLREMHDAIRVDEPNRALGLYRRLGNGARVEVGSPPGGSIQGDLEQMADLYAQQDKLVRERLVENLRGIVTKATQTKRGAGTSPITSIMAMVDSLKQFQSVAECGSAFEELRSKLFETFPIWVVRKQAVPFLLPCEEQSFDLVVVDEATQCRVDDAMSLMFRARKLLVVGDDKQTVLQKDSVIDDYLFKDHELEEHLRSTQARGFKGGGSNIFALVKSIKQAAVLLDEHYRCPADVIEFSNKYVYDDELNVMQWSLPDQPSAVVVDYSEKDMEGSKKPTSGKFKGIETAMIDRYMEYVVNQVRQIERETGRKVNMETDVALCYFLLKNEPYVKAVKDKYLRQLNRGEDVLDGAGAALQGKERDYIFYFWDVTRHNLSAFTQGDDADKRKGELNVLMSRPKKKAFHFLHRNFEQLEHGRSNITRFLWRKWLGQQEKEGWPTSEEGALGATLLGSLLEFILDTSSKRSIKDVREALLGERADFRSDVVVGDAGRVVDLIAFPKGNLRNVVGLVDLSGFGSGPHAGQAVVDYYFQLRRVSPGIEPVFLFPYEVLDENGQSFRSLVEKFEDMDFGEARAVPERRRA